MVSVVKKFGKYTYAGALTCLLAGCGEIPLENLKLNGQSIKLTQPSASPSSSPSASAKVITIPMPSATPTQALPSPTVTPNAANLPAPTPVPTPLTTPVSSASPEPSPSPSPSAHAEVSTTVYKLLEVPDSEILFLPFFSASATLPQLVRDLKIDEINGLFTGQTSSQSFEILFNQSSAALLAGKLDLARNAVTALSLLKPDYPPILYNLGLLHLKSKDYAKVDNLLNPSGPLSQEPRLFYILQTLRAEADNRSGDVGNLLNLDFKTPFDPIYAYLLARNINATDSERSKNYLNLLLTMHPEHLHGLVDFAKVQTRYGDYQDAKKTLEKAEKLTSKNAELYTAYSLLYQFEKHLQKSVEAAEKASQLAPENFNYIVALAKAYRSNKQRSQALMLLTDQQHFFVNLSAAKRFDYYLLRGQLASEVGDLNQAILNLNQAILLNPNSSPARYERGVAYAKQGSQIQAEADFELVFFNLKKPISYYERGIMRFLQKRFTEAKQDFETYLKYYPNEPITTFNLAVTLAALEQYEQAVKVFLEIPEDSDSIYEVYANIAKIYALQGKCEESQRYYQKAGQSPSSCS